jgi:uncharacterized protein YuzE
MDEMIEYDDEEDILYYNEGNRAKDSLRIKDFIIDFDSTNRVVGLEILNASKNIEMLVGEKPSREDLNGIVDADISVRRRGEMAVITFVFFSKNTGEKTTMRIPMNADPGMMA